MFVSSGNAKILVDAGLPGKNIEKALKDIEQNPEELDAIFVTHEHSDHIKGVGVLSRRYNIPIYANEPTWKAMEGSVGSIKEHNIKLIHQNSIAIKDMDIVAYDIPHDSVAAQGYAIYEGKKQVSIATDLGYFSDEVRKNIENANVILIESNHDVEMVKIGHLSNEDCGKAIVDLIKEDRKKVILGHLSQTNNYPELAYQTVVNILRENNIQLNKDIGLTVAKRDMPSNYVEF
jgi:phosphoribosyl 1,2-cyclic phosphodiesterase